MIDAQKNNENKEINFGQEVSTHVLKVSTHRVEESTHMDSEQSEIKSVDTSKELFLE